MEHVLIILDQKPRARPTNNYLGMSYIGSGIVSGSLKEVVVCSDFLSKEVALM